MAEFWWGSVSAKGDKVPGQFYGACAERCQPLMGFLLSGMPRRSPPATQPLTDLSLPILYEDEWLIAVNKPAGLLSVPGRYCDRQDSVLSRLSALFPNSPDLLAIHRLDQDTSGILLVARDRDTYRHLSQQFQQRQVHKVYEALLAGAIAVDQGIIELPLWADPSDRPYQKVDWQQGKPCLTRFRVLAREGNLTRIELIPVTGRTHQLRVHAAHPKGLGTPILGDRLYGHEIKGDRLYLNARELWFAHPKSGQRLHLQTQTSLSYTNLI
jgi:tRNA pseudouridine32 synthase/23S rRNA pseudouridine746 synthase